MRTERVSSAAVSLSGRCPLMQSGICKWHLWCDGHWQTSWKYESPEGIILEISLMKWQQVILRVFCCIFNKLYTIILMQMTERNVVKFYFPVFPLPVSPCKHTHARRQTKQERDKEGESEREVFTKWPFWTLSKGFVSHYGDLEKSPCSLIPLLLLWLKVSSGSSSPWNEGPSSLGPFFCKRTEKLELKFQ